MRFFSILIFLSFYSVCNLAQEKLTLGEAIRKALEHNYDVRVADVTVDQAAANNTIGNAGLLPNINGVAGVNTGLSNTRNEFADGRVQQVRGARTLSYNAGLQVSYTVFAAGRAWLIKRQLGRAEELAEAQFREQIQNTISQVIQTYARAVWQSQQRIAIDTGLALAQLRMMLSQMKFESGVSAKVDFLQARVDYNARQSDSLQQEAALNSAFADINFLMGEDPYKTYDLDDSLTVNTSLLPSDPQRLQQSNISIDIARRNVDLSRLDQRIARTFMFPTLTLNGGYNYNRSQNQAGFSLFNQSSGPSGGLGLSVPLFQGGNLRRQVRVASLETLRQEILLERQSTEISRQYRTAWKDYQMSVASFNLERQNLVYARENMDIQKARFRVGIATTLETREAENSYIQSLIRYYTSVYNLKVNETRVLQIESALQPQ